MKITINIDENVSETEIAITKNAAIDRKKCSKASPNKTKKFL